MTLEIDGVNVMAIVEIVAFVASVIAMLVVGLLVYLMVRPPRHVRERRRAEKRGEVLPREADPAEAEQLGRLVDRMETRLEVLERALADQLERPAIARRDTEQDLAPVEDRQAGRME